MKRNKKDLNMNKYYLRDHRQEGFTSLLDYFEYKSSKDHVKTKNSSSQGRSVSSKTIDEGIFEKKSSVPNLEKAESVETIDDISSSNNRQEVESETESILYGIKCPSKEEPSSHNFVLTNWPPNQKRKLDQSLYRCLLAAFATPAFQTQTCPDLRKYPKTTYVTKVHEPQTAKFYLR